MTQAIVATEKLTQDPFIQSVQQIVVSGKSPVIPVGGRTKTGLISDRNAAEIELREYCGIVTYDPSEYLITAKAGTTIAELNQSLAQHNQYLPFDPMWIENGATIGGTIASGVSGPDRLLYGGVRDFVMEVALIDGLGQLVRGGGKVVKNAAGFDSPKMMVGSYGRMGILVEATLKVFPSPQAYMTIGVNNESLGAAITAMQRVLAKPLPISSVIIDQNNKIYFRIAGPAGSLEGVVERILALLPNRASAAVESDEGSQRQQFVSWLQGSLNADESLIRIGISPKNVPQLQPILADCQHFYAAACSIAWAKLSNGQLAEKDRLLQQQGLSAVAMNGSASQPFWGDRSWLNMARRIQQAIDPNNRFLQWA